MRNPTAKIITSVGVEIETEDIFRGTLPRELRDTWGETHDASIETPVFRNPNFPDIFSEERTDTLNLESIVGNEIVSRILDSDEDDLREIFCRLFDWIYSKGEKEESTRSGIHIHVSMSYNTQILRNLAVLAGFSEPIFYYLGGMGYTFRGVFNDCTYCRPLTEWGVPVLHSTQPYLAYNLENMINSRNSDQFFDAYGIDYNNPPGKYNPSRYGWITFYNLLTKGTVELRVLNKTLNVNYLLAVIKLFQKFCATALQNTSIELPIRSIYHPLTKEDIINDLELLVELIGGLDPATEKTILHIISRTPMINLEHKYTYTHLQRERYSLHRFKYWKPIYVSDIQQPKFIDVHTLGR